MTLSDLQEHLEHHGIKLSVRGAKLHYEARKVVLTPEIKKALVSHKAALLAMLTCGVEPETRGSHEVPAAPDREHATVIEPITSPLDVEGEAVVCLPSHWWRNRVARWPIPWREAWGRLANLIEDMDSTASWAEAERGAYAWLEERYNHQGDAQHALDAITEMLEWPRIVLSRYTRDTQETRGDDVTVCAESAPNHAHPRRQEASGCCANQLTFFPK
jgi:hypothetical protein